MAITAPPFDDWIKIAQHPYSQHLFFLGTADQRITLYSQQVRALHLIHALSEKGYLRDKPQVAVVGAGAAGITAALALATLEIDVDLIERSEDVLHLQSASTRLLHPHIYDWPRCGSLRRDAVLPFLGWGQMSGGDVCRSMRLDFAAAQQRYPRMHLLNGQSLNELKLNSAGGWTVVLATAKGLREQDYDIVILALGFGDEEGVGDAPAHDYWKGQAITTASETERMSYLLSGNGDGGLADAMTLLIKEFDHVRFTEQFLNNVKDQKFASTLTDIFNGHAFDADLTPAFQEYLDPLLHRRRVTERLSQEIRRDRRLTLNCSGALLANGRAAPLNQVITFALLKAAEEAGNPVTLTQGRISAVARHDKGYVVTGPILNGLPCQDVFDRVILRHGPVRPKRYTACADLYKSYCGFIDSLRKTQGHMFVPPVLAADTFSFFEPLHAKRLEHHIQSSIDGLRVRRQRTVQISWDQATYRPVQQGGLELLEIAAQCERLQTTCDIQLDLRPGQIEKHEAVLRELAQISNGQINLHASSSFSADWERIASMEPLSSPYPIRQLPALNELRVACDQSLMRQLGTRIRATCAACNCPKLGAIHTDIASQLNNLWTKWDSLLQADPPSMRHFLAHLEHASVEVTSSSTEKMDFLSAALILMLATYIQQPLLPTQADGGNFNFAGNAVGLVSGAESRQNKPIVDFCALSDWDADALILSGAQEPMDFDEGSLSDAGSTPTSADRAERVEPVVIQASKLWRKKLEAGLPVWLSGVETAFSEWRLRQDKQLMENQNDA